MNILCRVNTARFIAFYWNTCAEQQSTQVASKPFRLPKLIRSFIFHALGLNLFRTQVDCTSSLLQQCLCEFTANHLQLFLELSFQGFATGSHYQTAGDLQQCEFGVLLRPNTNWLLSSQLQRNLKSSINPQKNHFNQTQRIGRCTQKLQIQLSVRFRSIRRQQCETDFRPPPRLDSISKTDRFQTEGNSSRSTAIQIKRRPTTSPERFLRLTRFVRGTPRC